MQEEEEHIGQGGPKPAYFDKEDVEEVFLLGEIGRSDVRGVGLRERGVRGDAGVGLEEGEEGAEKEGAREDCQQEGLEGGGEE